MKNLKEFIQMDKKKESKKIKTLLYKKYPLKIIQFQNFKGN